MALEPATFSVGNFLSAIYFNIARSESGLIDLRLQYLTFVNSSSIFFFPRSAASMDTPGFPTDIPERVAGVHVCADSTATLNSTFATASANILSRTPCFPQARISRIFTGYPLIFGRALTRHL